MKGKGKYTSIALLCVLIITGCGTEETADTYIAGTDYPWQYYRRDFYGIPTVEGNGSVYFNNGHYIYQLDEETDILTPLCNKTNCLHTQETDDSRRGECNAYIPEEDASITYMDGYIYSVVDDWSGDEPCDVLYKLAEDGSTKETIYQWEGQSVEGWCMHRDVLYYVEHTFDADNQEHYAVKAMKLSGMGRLQSKTIFEPEEGLTVYGFGMPEAYGNHLYINLNGVLTDEIEDFTDEEWIRYSYNKTFQYNLQDKSMTEIRIPDQSESQQVSDVTFWQDKIIYTAMDITKNHEYDFTLNIDIYDRDMNLVDTVQAPFHSSPYEPSYGSGDRMYVQVSEESGDTFAIEYWDKTKIGTYQGEEYQLTRICEQPIK